MLVQTTASVFSVATVLVNSNTCPPLAVPLPTLTRRLRYSSAAVSASVARLSVKVPLDVAVML